MSRTIVGLFAGPVLLAVSLAVVVPAYAGTYPTNKCVSSKQKATAKFCQAALKAWQKYQSDPDDDPAGSDRDAVIDDAADDLVEAWGKADLKAATKEAECAITTITSVEIDANMRAAVDGLATLIRAGLDDGDSGDRKCGARVFAATAKLCAGLFKAESKFIKGLAKDPERLELAEKKAATEQKFEDKYDGSSPDCSGALPTATAIIDDVNSATDATVLDTTTSPSLPTVFVENGPIPVGTQIRYKNDVLEPRCLRETPWTMFYKRGTVNNLLMYYEGGGACWSGLTCNVPSCKDTSDSGDNPDLVGTGFADPDNPLNIFKDWHAVFVTYCTCDIHFGSNVETYGSGNVAHHVGRINSMVGEKFAREHFPNPDKVVVTGSSAGSYGAMFNAPFLIEEVYPASEFSVIGDAGIGVVTKGWMDQYIDNWRFDLSLPKFVPGVKPPVEDLAITELMVAAANHYPQHRFAHYSSTYDEIQTQFFHIMKAGPNNILDWPRWWESQCEWTSCLRTLADGMALGAPNFRYYVSAGSRHTMFGADKVYADVTGPVPITIRDWVEAMVEDDVGWSNVDCINGGDCDLIATCQGGTNAGLQCSGGPDCPGGSCDDDPDPGMAPYDGMGTVSCPPTNCDCYEPGDPVEDIVCD